MQMEIALSTCESEYIALSTGMKGLIPVHNLVAEIGNVLQIERDQIMKVAKVWEDNNAALKLATAQFPNMSPHTKHIAIKYHWFRSHLKEEEN